MSKTENEKIVSEGIRLTEALAERDEAVALLRKAYAVAGYLAPAGVVVDSKIDKEIHAFLARIDGEEGR